MINKILYMVAPKQNIISITNLHKQIDSHLTIIVQCGSQGSRNTRAYC